MEKRITGIMRSAVYGPNGGYERDQAVIQAVAETLTRQGWQVTLVGENDFNGEAADTCFTMARSPRCIAFMNSLEAQGTTFVNTPEAIKTAARAQSVSIMRQAGIPMPATQILHGSDTLPDSPLPVWVKRGDACTQHQGDITLCNTMTDLRQAVQHLLADNATEVVLSQHIAGTLVKFYGVTGTPFFAAFSSGKPFLCPQLEDIARLAAAAHHLDVWGGDCIIPDGGGTPLIIDFNDWPSFASCRRQAAEAIATRIEQLS